MSMYRCVRSKVYSNSHASESFACKLGVRQGECLRNTGAGVTVNDMTIFVLLYTDDAVSPLVKPQLGGKAELEQLERLRSEDTLRRLMITHTIESYWVPNQNKVKWPWRYRSRSKVITCDTPSHASDHLCQMWKESIGNSRCYRADTIFKAKAKWPSRYRSRSKVIICNTPPYTSDHLC